MFNLEWAPFLFMHTLVLLRSPKSSLLPMRPYRLKAEDTSVLL